MFGSLSVIYGIFPLIFLNFITVAKADISCGSSICYGNDFCCSINDVCCDINDDQCCSVTIPVYHVWWFWFVWFLIFLGIMSCSYTCWRKRYRNRQIIQVKVNRVYGQSQPQPYIVGPQQGPYQGYNIAGQPILTQASVAPPPYKGQLPPYSPS